MEITTTTLKNEPACPACGETLNGLSSCHGVEKPMPGDISICGTCMAYLEFDENLNFIIASQETIAEFPDAMKEAMEITKILQMFGELEK